ncbi:MAG: hypothetical protein R3252_07930 [Robiginitalea sp.]|nr:hypothetical protein [Robiginitalea sp.]
MRRKSVIIIGLVFVLLLGLFVLGPRLLNPILEKSLDRYAREKIRFLQKTPTYSFHYEDLDLDLKQQRITLHNFSMKPLEAFREAVLKGESDARTLKRLAVNEVVIEGVGLMNFLWDKSIEVRSIRIDSVTLDLLLPGRDQKKSKKDNKPPGLSLEGISLPGIKELALGTFELGSFTLHQMALEPRDTLLSFTSAGGRFEGLRVKKGYLQESVFEPDLGDLTLYLDKERLDLRKNLYTVGFRNMEYSYAEQNLHIRDLLYRPREERDSFRLKNKYSYEVYEATSTDLILEDFDLNAFLDRGEFLTNRMLIDSLRVEIYRDKSKPFDTRKKKLLPNQILAQASFPFHIGEVNFRDAYLNYVEQVKVGAPPLVVDFYDLDGTITHLTTLPDSMLSSQPLVLDLKARLDREIPMAVRVELPYDSERFTVNGRTEGTSNFSSLNKTVLPAIGLQFKSGRLDGLRFDMHGTPYTMRGNLTLLYHNLEVELYRENHEKRKTLSWAANVLLKKSNPKPNGNTVVSEIYTERVSFKGFWNYLWKGLESGLINSLNPFGKHRVVRK